jgi:galactokinase
MAQCTAKSKQQKRRCKRHATPGMKVCRMHGGKTPVGAAAAAFKHGRYSKILPTVMAEHYQRAKDDQEWMSLREEIALVDARIAEVLAGAAAVKSQRPQPIWEAIGPLMEQRRRLIETESRRVKDLHDMISRERAYTLIAALADAVRRHVSDRNQLALINADFVRLTRGGVVTTVDGDG